MAIIRNPTRVNLRGLYLAQMKDPATTCDYEPGDTTAPENFVVPTYQIVETKNSEAEAQAMRLRYYGKLPDPRLLQGAPAAPAAYGAKVMLIRQADEGTNRSVYLGAGVYETNYTFDLRHYEKEVDEHMKAAGIDATASYLSQWQGPSQPRVYLIMPEDMADLNKKAETEHCNDFMRAYQLTLKKIEDVIIELSNANVGRHNSPLLPRGALETQMRQRLPLQLQDALLNPHLCGQKYLQLCKKSREERDDRDWHSFGLQYVGPDFSPPTVEYLTGAPRQEKGRLYLRYTKGKTEIDFHPSEIIIRF